MTMLWLAVDDQETIIIKIYYRVLYNIDKPFSRRDVHHTLLSHEK
jgi:hypothetical protein